MASWQATARRSDLRHGSARPAHQRRVSGPLRPAPAGPRAVPNPRSFDRVRTLPDHRFLDRLLRSRAWIWLIGIGLGGIVAMQVSMLKLNAGISRAVEASSTLERQNAELEGIVAGLMSGERVRAAAQNRGMVLPAAGSISFLTTRGADVDASRALRRMQPPSSDAIALLRNGGREPGALVQAPAIPAAPTTTATATAPVTAAQPGTTVQTAAPAGTQQAPVQQQQQQQTTPTADPQAVTAGGASPTG